MKQETNPRRGRGRNTGKRNPNQNSRSRNYDNSGSDNKVRGSSQQILDKYLALARDASLAGDRIAAEGFHQYAEHYFRLLNPEPGTEGGNNSNQHSRKPRYENQQKQQNRQNQPEETPAQPIQQPQTQPQQNEQPAVDEAKVLPVEPVAEAAVEPVAASAGEQVVSKEEVVEVKPRRRGRPRKVEASEPAA